MLKNKDFLILGHPRCGTAYMAALMRSAGIKIRHENMGSKGISCWVFATDSNWRRSTKNIKRSDFRFKHIIHNVRNPAQALSSILYTENVSLNFRKQHVHIDESLSPLSQAIQSFIEWNKLIEKMNPDLVVQVENCEDILAKFLKEHDYPHKYLKPTKKNANHRKHSDIPDNEWKTVPGSLKQELNQFCEKYGYEKLSYC